MKKKNEKLTTKEIKKMIHDSDEFMDEMLLERAKYSPTHIAYDRIQTRLNAYFSIKTRMRLELVDRKLNRAFLYLFIVSLSVIFSFFQKPKLLFELTFNTTLLLAVITGFGVILGPIIHANFTEKDREAKRLRDLAEAEYFKLQAKDLKKELEKSDK